MCWELSWNGLYKCVCFYIIVLSTDFLADCRTTTAVLMFFLFRENVWLCDDKVWDKGDVDAVTRPSLLPPRTPTSKCVNNTIAFSADEWGENAIKETRKAIQHDV